MVDLRSDGSAMDKVIKVIERSLTLYKNMGFIMYLEENSKHRYAITDLDLTTVKMVTDSIPIESLLSSPKVNMTINTCNREAVQQSLYYGKPVLGFAKSRLELVTCEDLA